MSQVSQVTISSPEVVLAQPSSNIDYTGGPLPVLTTTSYGLPHSTIDKVSSDSLLRITDIVAPHSGSIRILELNKPSTRNAISRALLAELRTEIDAIRNQYDLDTGDEVPTKNPESNENGPTRALIIASALDSCFCAGADLKERRGFAPAETTDFLERLRATFTALSQLPIPTISAIGSLALGGGLELALATDFRVVSTDAILSLPETRLGIIPGAGGIYRLSALVGVSRAKKLVLTGQRVTGTEAYRLGIADCLVEGGLRLQGKDHAIGNEQRHSDSDTLAGTRREVLAEAVKLAQEICQGGPVAVRAAIQAFQDGPDAVTESAMYDRVMMTEDRNEALRAFGEKRKPVFKGR